ncbi:MAG TPA: TatA/E family twin arginine-targeting protein translocase [Nitrospirota bacterium]
MFGLGFPEILLIFVIALIVFGPKKLPELGKTIGRAMAEFKKAQQEFQESVRSEMKEAEKDIDVEELRKLGKTVSAAAGPGAEEKQGPGHTAEQKPEPEQKKSEETKGDA